LYSWPVVIAILRGVAVGARVVSDSCDGTIARRQDAIGWERERPCRSREDRIEEAILAKVPADN
jgi:hypothetical protein